MSSQTKDVALNPLVREFNEYAPEGKRITETTTLVGSAVSVGTTRTIAGFSCEIFVTQDGVKHPWLAVRFTDGTKASLRSLMGLPSLEGFRTEGSLTVDEYTGGVSPEGEKERRERTISATADIEASERYTPPTWCVNDFLNREAETLKGASVTYHGVAIREYTVHRPLGNQVPGGRAVISVDLWTVEKPG